MPIPKYDEMTLPILKILGDEQEHTSTDLVARMAEHFRLTPEEQATTLPSTKATYLKVRAGWAAFALRKAGLVTATDKGRIRITDGGRQFLATNPSGKLNRTALKQFEGFRVWSSEMAKRAVATRHAGNKQAQVAAIDDAEAGPQERMEAAFREWQETLIADLRAKLATVDPFRFQQIVLDLLVAMGYGSSTDETAQVMQKTNDQGIDGMINQDRLGFEVIYVQAKRWQNNIGRPDIQGVCWCP